MSWTQSSGRSMHAPIPDLPPRPQWTSNGLLSIQNVCLPPDGVETVTRVWNEWADAVEDVFRTMNKHSHSLDVSVEDYIGWISRFSNHPERPAISPGEEERDRMMGVPLISPMRAHSRWEAFADKLKGTYAIMVRELSLCKLRPGDAHELIDGDIEIPDLSSLSLSSDTSTITQIKAVFTAMLGPGRSFHRAPGSSEYQQTAIPSNSSWHVDGQTQGRPAIERWDAQYPEEGPSEEWANGFLETLREINREMEEEDYRELDLQGLNIKDRGTED